jgi:hypothetical protein
MVNRSGHITLGAMRLSGVRSALIHCSENRCGQWTRLGRNVCDQWDDDVNLIDIESKFVCQACGRRGAAIRPDNDWDLSQ